MSTHTCLHDGNERKKNMQQYNMNCLQYGRALVYYLLCFKAAYHRVDSGEINCLDKDARCSLGVLMYRSNVLLLQRPNIFISSSDTPANFADVAAPMRKLWVVYLWWSSPVAVRIAERDALKNCLVSGVLLLVTKRGPGLLLLRARYGRIALIGQII